MVFHCRRSGRIEKLCRYSAVGGGGGNLRGPTSSALDHRLASRVLERNWKYISARIIGPRGVSLFRFSVPLARNPAERTGPTFLIYLRGSRIMTAAINVNWCSDFYSDFGSSDFDYGTQVTTNETLPCFLVIPLFSCHQWSFHIITIVYLNWHICRQP